MSAAGPTTEQTLAEFWTEVLESELDDAVAVGPEDRIVELGGNSLVATMLANRIELTWGFRPSMEELLTCTLRELSELCEARRRDPR